jgi:hypothetical protein
MMADRNQKYILNADGDPVPVDLLTWAAWFEDVAQIAHRRIARTTLPDGRLVSTVFLGLDHRYGDGPPLLFETMVFRDGEEEACDRYTTRAEALAGHARIVAAAQERA